MEQAIKRLKETMGKDNPNWEVMRGSNRPVNGVIGVKNVPYKVKAR